MKKTNLEVSSGSKYKRRDFLKKSAIGAAGGVAALSIASPAIHAQTKVRWRLASSFPKSLDTIFGAADVFADAVNQASNGNFKISIFAGGELMKPFDVLDGVQDETVECAHTAAYYYIGKDETFALDCTIPFGLNARQRNAWMYDGNGMKLLREFYSNYKMLNFPMGNTGVQMGGWFKRAVRTEKDFKGLKMRIAGFAGRIMQGLGVVPQNLPGGEIYQALEKGTIDATEWVGPYDDKKLGFNKVAGYYLYPAWWEGGPQLSLLVGKKAWNALPSSYKAMVNSAAVHAHTDMMAKYDSRNPRALKELIATGTKLLPMPKQVMINAFEISQGLYADLSKKNSNWRKIHADWEKFRKDQVDWWKVAEKNYQDFMSYQL
ncbi:MAG: TRAP transporter substrate-binding protein DctP [SAR324 cluster bacterium]|nr:TRAP transporter substrate-binding protein DctP [SAR324 cluster bacterium]